MCLNSARHETSRTLPGTVRRFRLRISLLCVSNTYQRSIHVLYFLKQAVQKRIGFFRRECRSMAWASRLSTPFVRSSRTLAHKMAAFLATCKGRGARRSARRPCRIDSDPEHYSLAFVARRSLHRADGGSLACRSDRVPGFFRDPDWRRFRRQLNGFDHGARVKNSR